MISNRFRRIFVRRFSKRYIYICLRVINDYFVTDVIDKLVTTTNRPGEPVPWTLLNVRRRKMTGRERVVSGYICTSHRLRDPSRRTAMEKTERNVILMYKNKSIRPSV